MQNSDGNDVIIPGTRTMATNTYFIASPFSASDNIKVAQDNECIMMGTLVQYRVEFGIEHLFSFTHLGRSIHCNNRRET